MAFIAARKEAVLVVSVQDEGKGCTELMLRSKFKHILNKCLLQLVKGKCEYLHVFDIASSKRLSLI